MSQHQAPPAAFRFGLFEVNGRSGELLKQGRSVRLRGRPFEILLFLLERHGDVITREELKRRLWSSDTFVDFDHGLNTAVNRLRDALGDSADNPRFIETLPKRGYRFIAPIDVLATAASEPLPPRESREGRVFQLSLPSRLVLAVAGTALVVAVAGASLYMRDRSAAPPAGSQMTLAVLPFQNLSSDPDQEFFSDGFTEEMIAEIGRLDPARLGVIARTTTMLYKGARKTVGQIRQELGVDYVLEGSVRRAGNRVRITAQLVQAQNMTHLWAESYDRDVSDVLAIQSEVAMRIARALALALPRPGAPPGHTVAASFPAYEHVLRGRMYREQATEESARKAIEHYQRALALDPASAAAYAGLADAYWLLGSPGWEVERPDTLLEQAKANAERALAIDPRSAEAHTVMAMVKLHYDWDAAGSEREIQESLRLNPSFARARQYYSATLTTMGRFDEAVAEARRAMQVDPLSAPAATEVALRYWYARRPDEACAEFTNTVEASPEFGLARWGLAQCYRRRGDRARSLDELTRAVQLSGNSAYMRAHLAYGLAMADNRARAVAIRQELEAEARERYASPYHFALIASGLGDRDAAVKWLQEAFEHRSGWMMFLSIDPEFDTLRETPEVRNLITRVRPRA